MKKQPLERLVSSNVFSSTGLWIAAERKSGSLQNSLNAEKANGAKNTFP